MRQRFRIQQSRSKKIWPSLTSFRPLRQIDFGLSFDVQPGNVEGWHHDPRQIRETNQLERGHTIHDYGTDIRAGRVTLRHPLLMQDEIDSLAMMSTVSGDVSWLLWNHRGDRLEARLDQDWTASSFRALPDYESHNEGQDYEDQVEQQVFFWDTNELKMLAARVVSGEVLVGYLGDNDEASMGVGANPTITSDSRGVIYVAFEKNSNIQVAQKGKTSSWSTPTEAIKNSQDFYPGVALYDPDSVYHSPAFISIEKRVWMFYIKTKNGSSVIQYRLGGQHWLIEHPVPTMGGKKTSLVAALIQENDMLRDRIFLAWINWDQESAGSSRLVPNVYRTYSTIPQIDYGVSPDGKFVTKTNEVTPVGTLNTPTDSISIELISNPQYGY